MEGEAFGENPVASIVSFLLARSRRFVKIASRTALWCRVPKSDPAHEFRPTGNVDQQCGVAALTAYGWRPKNRDFSFGEISFPGLGSASPILPRRRNASGNRSLALGRRVRLDRAN